MRHFFALLIGIILVTSLTVSSAFAQGTAELAIDDVTITEGNSGTTSLTFTVSLSAAVSSGFTVNYATTDLTATTADNDYNATSGTLSFVGTNGAENQTFSVPINGDTKVEGNEKFYVQINNVSSVEVLIADPIGFGTIVNDDFASLSINDVTNDEGDAGTTTYAFNVTLDKDVAGGFNVSYSTADLTATVADNDYVTNTGILPFTGTAGETQTINVTVNGDLAVEGDESFYVVLYNATNGGVNLDDNLGFGLINNDDSASLSIADAPAAVEGNAGTTNFSFDVTLDTDVDGGFTVNYTTSDGTATSGSDYALTAGNLIFTGNAGETQTITVAVNGDTMVEPNETFDVVLSNVSNAGVLITDGTGTTTINNDDSATLNIDDITLNEGDSGTTNFSFTVTSTALVQAGFTVDYATTDGTATTADSDYTSTSGTLTFTGSDTTKTITVPVTGDTKVENTEDFTVTLSNVVGTGVSIGDGSGTGTIQNDDVAELSVNDVTQAEGDAGTTTFDFTVSLSKTSDAIITVNYATTDGTANAGTDYVGVANTLTFNPGESSAIVSVTVNGDFDFEPDETFTLDLSTPSGATILDGSGTGTITNDDFVNVTIDDVSDFEANTPFVFTVTADRAITDGFSLTFETQDGTATTANSDYVALSSTIDFTFSNPVTQTISITVNDDAIVEGNETFTVNLTGVVAGPNSQFIKITDNTGLGTIQNDDAATVSIAPTSGITEGSGGGTTDLAFDVTLSGATVQGGFTVPFTITDVTTNTSDYASGSGTVTFTTGTVGEIAQAIVKVNADSTVETTETLDVVLGIPSLAGVSVTNDTGTGTITDDDSAVVNIGDVTQLEGTGVNKIFTFTVSLTNPVEGAVDVDFTTADVSAVAPGDYTANSGTVNFVANDVSQEISITVIGDTDIEADETFEVQLSNLVTTFDVTLGTTTGTGTLTNDDKALLTISDATPTTEGSGGGTTTYTFNVTLDRAVPVSFDVDFATQDGTALAGSDYTANSGSLMFAGTANEVQQITVDVSADDTVEIDEAFAVVLSNPSDSRVSISDAVGAGTITNDDTATLTLTGVTQAEGNAGTTNFNFDVTLDTPVDGGFNISYTTVNGTAVNIQDYTFASGSLTFAGAAETQTITVQVIGDTVVEPDETFNVQLSAAIPVTVSTSDITVSGSPATGTITNDDVATLTINDVTLAEGDAGTTAFDFNVTLDNAVTGGVTVDYVVNDVSTTAGTDYAAVAPGTLNFTGTAGETQTISVSVNGDTTVEPDETFNVILSNVVGSSTSIADNTGVGTITNDDVASVTIEDITLAEGDTGTTAFSFTATLNADVEGGFTVDASVADGTATAADNDYTATTQTLTFAGTSGETQSYTVAVNGDTKIETDENFTVSLSSLSNALVNISDTAVGTITNDDSATLTINDVTTLEGDDGVTTSVNFTVTLDNAVAGGFTVDYATVDGTATTADNDYAAASGSLTFVGTAGEVQNITVDIIGDGVLESDETFTVALNNSSSAAVDISDTAIGTIINDDNELLSNGSFEIAGDSNKTAQDWNGIVLSYSNDRRKCNPLNPNFAPDGQCVFKFKFDGTIINSARQIRQRIDNPPLIAGDMITFNGQVKAKELVRQGKIVVKVVYGIGNVDKIKLPIAPGTYPYTTLSGNTTLTGTPQRILVIVKARTTNGIFFVDDLSLVKGSTNVLTLEKGSTTRSGVQQPLDLPAAPDNFRN